MDRIEFQTNVLSLQFVLSIVSNFDLMIRYYTCLHNKQIVEIKNKNVFLIFPSTIKSSKFAVSFPAYSCESAGLSGESIEQIILYEINFT